MAVDLIEVPLENRKLVERFIRVPWFINREHHPSSHWVPPLLMDRRDYLNPKKNPFFDHVTAKFWLAVKDGKDVGRVAGVVDHDYLKTHGEKMGYLGMFEAPDDDEVARALDDKACGFLREQGMTKLFGPAELSANYQWGCLIEPYDRDPGIQMPYNPPYYPKLFESLGYRKATDLLQWAFDVQKPLPPRVERLANRVARKEGITIRQLKFNDWDAEVRRTLTIYNDAWEKNWGFVPISEKEYLHVAKDLKLVLNPRLGLIAEHEGEPVAFALSIMNVNPTLKKVNGRLFPFGVLRLLWDLKIANVVDEGRLILLGVREPFRNRGIELMLIKESHDASRDLGYKTGELGWTLEDNDGINRIIQRVGGEICARYRVFEKDL